jgi:hypothetical protein
MLDSVAAGDWGLGIGDWGLGANPQSPIPNPQSKSMWHIILEEQFSLFIFIFNCFNF